jgi:hypothetical protein
MAVRAKFRCLKIVTEDYGGVRQTKVHLGAVMGRVEEYGENDRYHQATPVGDLMMQVDNPAALAQFQVNKSYYLDFTPAPE